MAKSNLNIEDDQLICFCYGVTYIELIEAIKKGAVTLRQIQEETLASTGCGGCQDIICEILDSFLNPDPEP